jgi:alanine dehydrogenase
MMRAMPKGAVFIDIGIDMGGIAETSKQTTWSAPIYVDAGVVHFCVANIPAQVPQAATAALAAAALPYVQAVAGHGVIAASRLDAGLAAAVQVFAGAVTATSVARDTGRNYQQLFAETSI